jgi:hypothetical protein
MAPTYLAELQRSKMTAGNSFDVPKAPTYRTDTSDSAKTTGARNIVSFHVAEDR